MDCNKDEAFRAKTIAEVKFGKGDYASAIKFASKAQKLYGQLEGISRLLVTLGVYVASERKICGEVDWYGMLDVEPSADEETIKKSYRKLALELHPDKNKSVGANGAFVLISQAWSLLSDNEKRLAYDQKRGIRGSQQRVWLHDPGQTSQYFSNRWTAAPEAQTMGQTSRSWTDGVFSSGNGPSQAANVQTTGVPFQSQPNGRNAKNNDTKAQSSVGKEKNNGATKKDNVPKEKGNGTQAKSSGAKEKGNGKQARNNGARTKSNGTKATRKPMPSPAPRANTFWTMCHHCHYHHEFVRDYLGRNLRCVTCHQPFIGNETAPPPNFGNSTTKDPQEQQQL